MLLRPAKRSFSETALVLWLEHLAGGWEDFFSAEALETGRAIYRRGEVRELSVFADEATVYVQWDDAAAHAVLAWQGKQLSWRTTLPASGLGDALAVAGLYEIEELLGDELAGSAAGDSAAPTPPVPSATTPEPAEATAPTPSEGDGPDGTDGTGESPRELVLVFSGHGGGVVCVPCWELRSGQRRRAARLPAYGTGALPAAELREQDRASLLRLTAHARRNGFVFDAALAGWRLLSPMAVATFARKELPVWAKRWRVEGRASVASFGRELPPLDLEAVLDGVDAASMSGDGTDGTDGTDTRAGKCGDGGFRRRWRLRLGDEWLPDSVARQLLASPDSAVLVPGRGLARLNARQQAALAEWTDAGEVLPRYSLLSLFNEERVRVSADAALMAWRAALLREPVPLDGLPPFLRPYQARGVAWLAHMLAQGTHPLLADEMGLGKTAQVLALLHRVPLTAPALVVCPASVVPVWVAESARFFPSATVRVLGGKCNWTLDTAPVLWVASYTQLRRHKASLDGVEFSLAVLDEAQHIKNPDTKVAQVCMTIRARHRLALSGTPVENHPRDIWTIFRFLMPGLLGRRAEFEARLERDSGAVARAAQQVRPFVLRRTKSAVAAELPPKVSVPLPCAMSETQREIYRRLVEEGVASLGNAAPGELFASGSGAGFLALLTRLRQAACDPGLLPGQDALPVSASGKISVLMERLQEILENGSKVVVFSQFVRLLDRVEGALRRHFPATPVFRLTGATQDRAAPVASFQEQAGAGVMLVSLRAGGMGITLHSAEYVFLLDPWWTPAVEAQAIDRVHRIGQKNATFVYRMIATDTVESRVEALKEAKAELFAKIVGELPDMSDWSAHFPSLRALVG
ncbi:MAG: DEAD/DEAH box helicase [Puniceicoccales bacterium]|jgi:superfamily II DNA or RNA helicase|nr:DEAD/DEAH box helicase [Puniceicoccales bacterium]